MKTLRDQLADVADAFFAVDRRSRARVSTLIFSAGPTLGLLCAKERDVTTTVFERAMAWFSEHWPADADWPADVPRPLPGGSSSPAGDAAAPSPVSGRGPSSPSAVDDAPPPPLGEADGEDLSHSAREVA